MVDEEEQVDTSPWAGTDRDYSYEEVCLLSLLSLPPITPTSLPGCGRYKSQLLLAQQQWSRWCHTTCCEKVAGPPASS